VQALGFSIVIVPGGLVRALSRTENDYFASLKATGSTAAFLDRMLDFSELNALIGTPEMLDLGRRYDSHERSRIKKALVRPGPSPLPQIIQKLRCGRGTGDEQMIACARAGTVEEAGPFIGLLVKLRKLHKLANFHQILRCRAFEPWRADTRNTFMTSSSRWWITVTAIYPNFGLWTAREVSLFSVAGLSCWSKAVGLTGFCLPGGLPAIAALPQA